MRIEDFINVNTFLLIGSMGIGLVYLVTYFKKGANDASVESNEILRGLIEDQKEEIATLRKRSHDLANEMTALKLQVQILTDRRDYLEALVVQALGKEFSGDPALAKTVKTLVKEVQIANKKTL